MISNKEELLAIRRKGWTPVLRCGRSFGDAAHRRIAKPEHIDTTRSGKRDRFSVRGPVDLASPQDDTFGVELALGRRGQIEGHRCRADRFLGILLLPYAAVGGHDVKAELFAFDFEP